ncbi:AAA domain protein [Aspergillus parasiticus SU-1]|uniref:AAA domain protein n=1 Tax=Aspergillus parasiticus (strain ATCC 56775 / NRRL 5862 / SRRC 143 / SU-1) TaxID=1403190 RepID=A0A0F0I5Z0_ASPPU|nr:AAA domain protein [Aspergillus parasiticus SU-1]
MPEEATLTLPKIQEAELAEPDPDTPGGVSISSDVLLLSAKPDVRIAVPDDEWGQPLEPQAQADIPVQEPVAPDHVSISPDVFLLGEKPEAPIVAVDDEWGQPLEPEATHTGVPDDGLGQNLESRAQSDSGPTITHNEASQADSHPLDVLLPVTATRKTNFTGPQPVVITLDIGKGSFIPHNHEVVSNGVYVTLQLDGNPVDPRLRIKATVCKRSNTGARIVHSGILDFGLLLAGEVGKLQFSHSFTAKENDADSTKVSRAPKRSRFRRDAMSEKYVEPCLVYLTFQTRGAVSHCLAYDSKKFDGLGTLKSEVTAVLDHLLSFTKGESEHFSCRLHLTPEDAEEWEEGSFFRNLLEGYADTNRPRHWLPYRSRWKALLSQYGQLRPREDVQAQWGENGIISVPAENYFHNLDEARVKLIYGSYLEHQFSLIQVQRLMDVMHTVTFVSLDGSLENLVAAISFTKDLNEATTPHAIQGLHALVREGTPCTIKWKYGNKDVQQSCSGRVFLNILALPFQYDLIVSIYGKRPKGMRQCLNTYPSDERPNSYDCSIEFPVTDRNVKVQIKTVNTLCSAANSKWHPVLLNHEYSVLQLHNIFDVVPEEDVTAAYAYVLSMKAWNESQVAAFDLLKRLPGGFATIEGIFGCGKTSVQAAMALLCKRLGYHVLMVAPSNAALLAVENQLSELDDTVPALRVLQSQVEKRNTFRSETQNDNGTETDHEAVGTWIDFIEGLNKARLCRYDTLNAHGLHNWIPNIAKDLQERNERLLFSGFHEKTTPKCSSGKGPRESGSLEEIIYPEDANDGIEEDADVDIEEQKDAITIYIDYMARHALRQSQERDQTKLTHDEVDAIKKDINLFRRAIQVLSERAVNTAKILLCTSQVVDTDIVRKYGLGTQNDVTPSRGIVVIADEDGQSLETEAWIPVAVLKRAHDIKGIIRFGDRFQLGPVVMSSGGESFNEFASQISRPLFDRILRSTESKVSLNIQQRMKPELSEFPNRYTYEGKVKNGASTHGIVIPPTFLNGLKGWISIYYPEQDMNKVNCHLLGISINGTMARDERTMSRYNVANVTAVMTLIERILPVDGYTFTLLVPYLGQKSLYIEALQKLSQRTGVAFEHLPKVHTIDTAQGHEADVILVDWTVTNSDMRSDLGFLQENRRVNVGLTRAKSCLLSVGNEEIASGELTKSLKLGSKTMCRYELVEHWKDMQKKDVIVRIDIRGNTPEVPSGDSDVSEPTDDKILGSSKMGWGPCDGGNSWPDEEEKSKEVKHESW